MKIAIIFAVWVGLMICEFSIAQSTNEPSETLSRARETAKDVKFSALTIDYGMGDILMAEQPTIYSIQLPIGGGSSFEKYPRPDVARLGLQVWLLRADGTAIPQRGKPAEIGVGNAGWDELYMMYTFDKGASNELAGIVVQAKGKLYSEKIGGDRK